MACAKGARKIEMACGTGKTRVMKELVGNVFGKAAWLPYDKQEAFDHLCRGSTHFWIDLGWLDKFDCDLSLLIEPVHEHLDSI